MFPVVRKGTLFIMAKTRSRAMERLARFFVASLGVAVVLSETPLRTDFDVMLATPPPLQQYQFQLQAQVQVLMSAGNVYYDANLDNIPLQAYEIMDQNGDPLGPYLSTNIDYENYVLDITPILTGVGLYPFHRGLELINASQRAWRLDYYKSGVSGPVYSTVMSGPMVDLGNGAYRLSVDLGLRWSEEGDNLNRLNQGRFSHIALAIGDFRTFTLQVDPLTPGSAQLTADVFSMAPTSLPTAMPSPAPTDTPGTGSTDSPTQSPASNRVPDTPSPTVFEGSGEDRIDFDLSGKKGKSNAFGDSVSGKKGSDDFEGRLPDDDCYNNYGYSGKKGKKHKKGCKKGKKKGKMSFEQTIQSKEGGTMVGIAAVGLLLVGWAFVAHRHNHLKEGYEPVVVDAEPPAPTIPTAFAAFGTFSVEEIKAQAAMMRVVPSSVTSINDDYEEILH